MGSHPTLDHHQPTTDTRQLANGMTGEERLGAGGVEARSRPPARSPP